MRTVAVATVLLAFLAARPAPLSGAVIDERVCIGTSGRMSVGANRGHHYQNLRDRYTNCTFVDGNLEITWLDDVDADLGFLRYIREVTGYVLISHVKTRHVVLPSLQIIRGRTLFRLPVHGEFALAVTLGEMETLQMPALRAVLNGNVGVFNNYRLCYVRSINWTEILDGRDARAVYQYNFTEPERHCECDKSCEAGCWGPGPENCQKFSKINCSPQCEQGRCFGPEPRQCCNLFCAGGCTGPRQSDCLACRNFYDGGECKEECPPMQRYNPTTYSWEPNPDGKYAYGATCVRRCPKHLFKDNGACVRACPPDKKVENQECVPCDGPCPRQCKSDDDVIHSGNVDRFEGCTVIQGSVRIMDHSFNGFRPIASTKAGSTLLGKPHPPMHPDKLEVFSSLRSVTGFISIQANHSDFRNLSYFRNLEEINGGDTTEYSSALYIIKTSLEFLGLRSLKRITGGTVSILENDNLCLAESVDWLSIRKASYEPLLKNNASPDKCRRKGLVCHDECSEEGCWGPGPEQCVACRNFEFDGVCIPACNAHEGLYEASDGVCAMCHPECGDGVCRGPGPGNCSRCVHVRDGPFCVAQCPESKFPDDTGVCRDCPVDCEGGCNGPHGFIGPTGCRSCHRGVVETRDNFTAVYCLPGDAPCPDGYYSEYVGENEDGLLRNMSGKFVCRKCHDRCKACSGPGFHISVCSECAFVRKGEQCELECPHDHYEDVEREECFPCNAECRLCHGPLSSDCSSCYNYKLYLEEDSDNEYSGVNGTRRFNCTSVCPEEAPHKILPNDGGEAYCAAEPWRDRSEASMPVIVGAVVGSFCLLVVLVCAYLWKSYQRAMFKADVVKMTTRIPGMEGPGSDDSTLVKPTIGPNLAQLRTVKEAELRKGDMLGYGAFGSVFKGVWVPEGENIKIPVAIKVLHDGAGADSGRAFLDEAKIMASVEHPNLLQLLAVCMTSPMMLVTQLMPLGCLLNYVRDNKDRIGSKAMLSWSTQIARGMAYLEDKRLVHRDLAARNVLVQTPQHVKITDFGLAKLLEINEEAYKAVGGKMPIKWLAMECITHRIFTHKSDVWAFGVTVWEILTYGAKPYEHIPAWEVAEFLQKGERLQQPPIASLDVYMIMIKCWILSPDDRPSFRELADEFAKMSRDPGRYLAIKGDRLMRLPSYTTQDQQEMIRTLAAPHLDNEGEIVMDAEEYLQPREATGGSSCADFPDSSVGGSLTSTETALANHRNLARSRQQQQQMQMQRPFPAAYPTGPPSLSRRSASHLAFGAGDGYKSLVGASHQHLPNPAVSSRFGSMVGVPVQPDSGGAAAAAATTTVAGGDFASMPGHGISAAGVSRTVTPNPHPHYAPGTTGHHGIAIAPRFDGPSSLTTAGVTPCISDPMHSLPANVATSNPDGGFVSASSSRSKPGEPLLYRRRRAKVGDMKLELPVDEDDYLVPSPRQAAGSSATAVFDDGGQRQHPRPTSRYSGDPPSAGYSPRHNQLGLDNPEYHMMAQQPPASHHHHHHHHQQQQMRPALDSRAHHRPNLAHHHQQQQQQQQQQRGRGGVAVQHAPPAGAGDIERVLNVDASPSYLGPPRRSPASSSGGGGAPSLPPYPARAPLQRHRSSGEESSDDHEYYNDLDRLEGELRPLQPNGDFDDHDDDGGGGGRNETTV